MTSSATVAIHRSQFPESVRRDLLKSLRTRRVNHKFHYDSVKQTQKWLALHQAHSPSRNDRDCVATYDRAFREAVESIKQTRIHVIGLGCGGGQKDARLLKLLKSRGKEVFYTPCDVSAAMVLVAGQTALAVVPDLKCFPLVCDLATTYDLPDVLNSHITHHASRITTFFGMIPNFEPQLILPKLATCIGRGDWLLFSANLAPGDDYAAGMKTILPQYDNDLTRDWLMTFLLDVGVKATDGTLRFTIENGSYGLKRVVARFQFLRSRRFEIEADSFSFARGDSIQLFFSYRYTPQQVVDLLRKRGLEVTDQWITQSQEEGVFLCRRI